MVVFYIILVLLDVRYLKQEFLGNTLKVGCIRFRFDYSFDETATNELVYRFVGATASICVAF